MKTMMISLGLLCGMHFYSIAQTTVVAQTSKESRELEHEEYINTQAGFTAEESLAFWTLYDEMEAKQKELRRANKQEMKNAKKAGLDSLTDEELNVLMNNRLVMEQNLVDLKKEYHQKFITLLGIRKTAKYYEAEMSWRKEVIKKFKDGKAGDGKGHRNKERKED